jgi:murein DD-endopeptidase MepM/ murein hydrolase activator NlpD
MFNNEILINHGDGTWGRYLHLKQDGAKVRVGQQVKQGEPIAASGNVGRSMLPHVHFEVVNTADKTLPITFADVPGNGIPLMFHRYTKGG